MSGSRYWNKGVRVILLSPSPRKTTYIRNIWNLGYLYLVLLTIVRVVGKRFCCGPELSGPEQDALCSEALDEDALILSWAWTILLAKQNRYQPTASKRNQKGPDWVEQLELAVVIIHSPTIIAPMKFCPSVIKRSGLHRNLCFRSVVVERSRSP